MSTYGRNVYDKVGFSIAVSADGAPISKVGGITVEWGAVAAAVADYEVRANGEAVDTNFLSNASPADDYVTAGQKYIRWGTVMCKIIGGTSAGKYAPYGSSSGLGGGTLSTARGDMFILNHSIHEDDYNSDHPHAILGGLVWKNRLLVNFAKQQTITIDATGGTFTVSYKGQTTAAQAYNVSAANLQTALVGLSTIGTGNATVSLNGAVYTITLADALGVHELLTTDPASLTGGGQTALVGVTSGSVYGPTPTEFEAAFPRISYVAG